MQTSNLREIDYVEFYVANAFQAANFYKSALGFRMMAYGGPDTGLADRVSYIIDQGKIKFILTSPLGPNSPIHEHVINHDDGVKDIAFSSDNVQDAFEAAINKGAIPILSPTEIVDDRSKIKKASIATFGKTTHSFIERDTLNWSLPFYKLLKEEESKVSAGLLEVDHIAVALEKGQLKVWSDFYQTVLDFQVAHREDVHTEYSGMNSLVVGNTSRTIKFPLVEPAHESKKSQIDTYLQCYGGSGVQHIAFLSGNIIHTVKFLQTQGIQFLSIPDSYYNNLDRALYERFGEDFPTIKELGILLDTDNKGFLLQIFSKPIQTRPTFFIEIIQRENSQGFGSGNIKALYDAVEREQQQQRFLV